MMKIKTQSRTTLKDMGLALLLAILVFLSRHLTRGAVYYVDGPILVQCILNHTYVIQPPGYWLFARTGGLFTDPAFGLRFMNEIFSASGVAIFFLLCLKFDLSRRMAFAASLCYGTIFFVWLTGSIHSSYASQVLAAPLLPYVFLLYRDRPTVVRLLACSACFALGAGLRPSDGVFLAPLFVFLAVHVVQDWRRQTLLFVATAGLCLFWYIPSQIALREAHIVTLHSYSEIVRPMSPLLSGVGPRTIANTIRVILPFLTAFGILLPSLAFSHKRFETQMLAVWIIPGMLFFLLVYMADPVYFTYLAAAMVLLTALSRQQTPALVLLLLCATFNTSVFLFARPLKGDNRVEQVVNFYVVKYCNYGIRHEWTSTIGKGGIVP
jgi:Dolichyl-phosphate-mannose-protein mannosyltransferase